MNLVADAATELIEENRLTSNPEFRKVFSNHFVGADGPKQMKRKWSHREIFFGKIFYGFIEIHRCLDRLEQIEVFLKKYKDCIAFRKKGITESVYLKYHVEKYLEEMYIFKERLIVYLTILQKHYKDNPTGIKGLKTLKESVNRILDGIVKTRGLHIHKNRFTDEDLNRLETYDLLLKVKRMPPEFEKVAKLELNKVTKMWRDKVESNNRAISKLMDIYFTEVHMLLFDEKGQIKM